MERFTFKKRNVLGEHYMYVAGANAHNRKEHLGQIEDVLEKYEIDDLQDLDERLNAYKFLANHEYSCVDANAYNIMLKDLEKYHKFIKIIKREPNAVIETITTYDSWEELCKDYPISDRTLWHIIKNKAEFDLLKEILQ